MLFIQGRRSYVISRNKQNNIGKLEECKTLVHSTGTKGANLEEKFLIYVFAAFSIKAFFHDKTNSSGSSNKDVFQKLNGATSEYPASHAFPKSAATAARSRFSSK